jgi:hypothetical protein
MSFEEGLLVYPKVKSDGGSSAYYEIDIPIGKVSFIHSGSEQLLTEMTGYIRIEVKDVIRYALDNDFDKGNIFKALVRLGKKDGASIVYDINKMRFFLDELEKELVHE